MFLHGQGSSGPEHLVHACVSGLCHQRPRSPSLTFAQQQAPQTSISSCHEHWQGLNLGMLRSHSPVQAAPVVIGRLEAQDREDSDRCVEGCHAVDECDAHGVLLTVIPGDSPMSPIVRGLFLLGTLLPRALSQKRTSPQPPRP